MTVYSALPEEEGDGDDTAYVWMHGDTSRTFALPAIDSLGKELVECTREALEVGIRKCGPGVPFSEIGTAIEWVTWPDLCHCCSLNFGCVA